MLRSIFVEPSDLRGIENSGANHLIVSWSEGMDIDVWRKLKTEEFKLGLSVCVFGVDGCPASVEAKKKLFEKLDKVLELGPEQIWLDHFRFDGSWELGENREIGNIHQECKWCGGKNRAGVLGEIAREIMSKCRGRTKVGYFAVPFLPSEVSDLADGLGQDHAVLGGIFDMVSPMLYHRMIWKPVGYISEYVKWLADIGCKSILPIIQVKDMPDNLQDDLSGKEINSAFGEAIKKPSEGVSFFWWTAALEKKKAEIIRKLFWSVK